MRFTTTQLEQLFDYVFANTAFPSGSMFEAGPAANVFALLYPTGSSTECTAVSHPGYARTSLTPLARTTAGANIQVANTADISGATNSSGSAWAEIDRVQLSRVSTVGDTAADNMLSGVFALSTARVVPAGQTFVYRAGEIVIAAPFFDPS